MIFRTDKIIGPRICIWSLTILELNWHNVVSITIWIIDGFYIKELVCLIFDHFTLLQPDLAVVTEPGVNIGWCHECHDVMNVTDVICGVSDVSGMSHITDLSIIINSQRVWDRVNRTGVILDHKSRVMRYHKGCRSSLNICLLSNFPPYRAQSREHTLIPSQLLSRENILQRVKYDF